MSDKTIKSPQIRFAEFTDAWEQRKLIEMLVQPITDGPHETPELVEDGIPFISVDAIVDNRIDFARRRGFITEKYNDQCCKKYSPQFHDVYLVKSGSTVGKTAIVETYERFNIWSPLAAMRCGDKSESYFLYNMLQTRSLQTQVFDKCSHGTQPNLSMRQLEQFNVSLPNIEEQKEIGTFFKNLDNLITLHQRKLELLKETKKSLLQKMFPKDGANVPKIRFAGFTDAWEQRKLDNILKERKVKQKISEEVPLLAFAAGQGVIDRSERKTNNRDFLTKDSTKKTYLLTKYNDIVYNPSNLKYGAIDRNKHGQGVISPIYVTFETDEIPSFIELILKSENFKQRALQYEEGTVTKRQSVKPENLLSLDVVLPNSKDEQIKIGKFFEQLDDTIALHQRELNSLKNLKKSLLQQMFI
ncbi:restriction endonuclease subunit S [Aneurinibacillus sp. Ricciae_BoGa-3]|uniref:restriction endonuclease subunit S n=1 Tax=Aneurinibacillus sp. Ricciae_BoGa-3 TaxID=3022697 RepID=UPI002340A715|nr:restriction endonuclease subunit S [Aneurinibacillus sp. Ricciae_BoGa-3]WCK55118.1 restriction endonuclease subunit S [Aneurinibacillus sp. Ricciae_BoGa-3]